MIKKFLSYIKNLLKNKKNVKEQKTIKKVIDEFLLIRSFLIDNNFTVEDVLFDGSSSFIKDNNDGTRIVIHWHPMTTYTRLFIVTEENEWHCKFNAKIENIFGLIAILSSCYEHFNVMNINFDYYEYFITKSKNYDVETYEVAAITVYCFLHKEEKYEDIIELIKHRAEYYKQRKLKYEEFPSVY